MSTESKGQSMWDNSDSTEIDNQWGILSKAKVWLDFLFKKESGQILKKKKKSQFVGKECEKKKKKSRLTLSH